MSEARHAMVIGGGLAGCEAAWQLASRGTRVTLSEMRPVVTGPAHSTEGLAELVCSNSMKSEDPGTAAGGLKHELGELGSLVLAAARASRVPAGAALAVDRARFSEAVTRTLTSHPLVTVERREVVATVPGTPTVVCTGPLTSEGFEPELSGLVGDKRLAFYDAAAPIVDADTLDERVVFSASRYGKGSGSDYLNCPFDRDGYERFIDELLSAQRVIPHAFETRDLFAACQPIEEIARRGRDAPRFGPMKPVGLVDPSTGNRPWAVVQLRRETAAGRAYNIVGFQTNLRFGEQERVFRMIPGFEGATFLRHGVMHRNTFIDAPRVLAPDLLVRGRRDIALAGQLIGTEGYLEAAATGLLAGVNLHASINGLPALVLPRDTFLGSLVGYATDVVTDNYQPMHVNMGLLPALEGRMPKRERYAAHARRARASLAGYLARSPRFSPVPVPKVVVP